MMPPLHIDFETASELELGGKTGSGLYNYATHPSTRVLMLAYAFGEAEPTMWFPHEGEMPTELRAALRNGAVTLMAFNSAFERYILKYKLGLTIPTNRFEDPQASARYLSLPADLETVGEVLGLPLELRKDKRGDELIALFCKPQKRKKRDGGGTYFNDWNTLPVEWAEFVEYCKQDVRAEREVARRESMLGAFPLPARERQIWLFDQTVNDRGIPVDRGFVEKAFKMADDNKQEKIDEQNKATGLDNANSAKQLLPWVRERGYPLNNLRKNNIDLVLKNPEYKITDECRKVLSARAEAGSTSYTKLQAILRNINADGRLRNQFIYMGSSRCGRWSGNAVQLHNLARPDKTFEDLDNVIKARNLIYGGDYDGLKTAFTKEDGSFYSPLIITKNIIRTVFVVPREDRFNVCDLNAIETRVGAWLAGCEGLLKVFAEGRDPYIDFATKMTGIPYEILDGYLKSEDKKLKAEAKRHRQIAKPGVLGAIYRLSGGGWGKDKNGDTIKTGLWGYAENMGVDMTQEQAHEVVRIFRESYSEIVQMWTKLEVAVMDVLSHERTVRYIGPDNCIKIDKVTITGRNDLLRIQLPSGRYLHYLDASIQTVKMPWQRKNSETGQVEDVWKPGFTYYGKDQSTDTWDMIVSHGGKIFENIVQGIARDVLADKLLEFEAAGLCIVAHVHDEGVGQTFDDMLSPGVAEMKQMMSTPVKWALSLPLGADGFEDHFYHK